MYVEDEEVLGGVVEGNRLQHSHPEYGNKQHEQQVCQ
jgi:hypothetical protein